MSTVILPERDIVPLRTRWRDDRVILLATIFGALLWIGAVVTATIFAVSAPVDGHGPVKAGAKR